MAHLLEPESEPVPPGVGGGVGKGLVDEELLVLGASKKDGATPRRPQPDQEDFRHWRNLARSNNPCRS